MNGKILNKKWFTLFLLPALTLYLIFVLLPIVWASIYSLQDWDGIGAMNFIGLQNYFKLFTDDPIFWQALVNTLVLMGISLVLIPAGLIMAIWLNTKIMLKSFFKTVIFLPLVMPSVVLGILWAQIYNPISGLLNSALVAFGLPHLQRAWLGEPETALLAILVVVLWQSIGFYVIVYLAGLQNIPEEMIEAAKIDGATDSVITLQIIIPLLSNLIKFTLIFNIITSLKYFDLVFIMTRGQPDHASEVVATHMYNQAFDLYNYGYASAIAFTLFMACVFLSFVLNRVFRRYEY